MTRIGNDIAAMLFGRPYAAPELRNRVSVADSILRRHTGRYEIAPGFVLTVRHGADGLELAGPDGDFLPLDPLRESVLLSPLVRHRLVRDR